MGQAGIALLSTLLAVGQAGTGLHFNEPRADIGEVRSGRPVEHTFHFHNDGPWPVAVSSVTASCGCLAPKAECRAYRPGEAGGVVLAVNTLSQAAGSHEWTVRVAYRDEAEWHEAVLCLRATVVPEVTAQPAELTVFADGPVTHEVVVTDLRPRPLHVLDVRSSTPELRGRVTHVAQDSAGRSAHHVRVEVAPGREGRHEEALTLYTDDPEHRELRVPVTIVRRPRQGVTVSPTSLSVDAAAGEPVPSQTLLVRDAQGAPVRLAAVDASDPALSGHWAQGPGTMATVKVRVDGARLHGDTLRGEIRIRVAAPVEATLVVPVTVSVR